MTWILHRLVTLAWALWLGGLVVLFMSVTSVFATLAPDRQAAGNITAPMFHRFERYQILLACVLVASTLALRFFAGPRLRKVFFWITLLTAALAIFGTAVITPRIDRGRDAGQTQTSEFRRAHGLSMTVYASELLLLALAGLALPAVLSPAPPALRPQPSPHPGAPASHERV